MPPDEQILDSLMDSNYGQLLGPAPVLANPCCLGKECTKADCLISRCLC